MLKNSHYKTIHLNTLVNKMQQNILLKNSTLLISQQIKTTILILDFLIQDLKLYDQRKTALDLK